MNKTDLVERLVIYPGCENLTKKAAGEVVTAVFDLISNALAERDEVRLVGFGTFETRERKERSGRNPKTGDTMTIPASVVPAFKPGAVLKERVAA